MRRKVLQDYVNKFGPILTGWRLWIQSDDIPILVSRQRGVLRIDVLSGRFSIDDDEARLGIAEELAAWFEHRLEADGIDTNGLRSADIEATFDCVEETHRCHGASHSQ